MKQRKQSPRRNAVNQTRPDIRSFFSSSPAPSVRKPKSPFSTGRASFFGTPATTAATPSPAPGTVERRPDPANPTPTTNSSSSSSSSSAAAAVTTVVSPSSTQNSSRKLAEVNGRGGGATKSPQQPPAPSSKRPAAAALPSGRAHKTPPPRPQAKEVIILTGSPTNANANTKGGGGFSSGFNANSSSSKASGGKAGSRGSNASGSVGGGDSADTGSVVLLGVKQESNKENGGKEALAASLRARGLLPPLGATTVGAATARSMSSSLEMSGYFLDGPTTTATTTNRNRTPPPMTRNPTPPTVAVGGGGGEGQGGRVKNASGRYALPVGDVVVGRDSIHDSKPANRNKLRMGIDKRDEGVSRSQATLRVCASSNRVLVTHRSAAVNGIRIFRWAGSPGLKTDEQEARQAQTPKKAKTASPATSPASAAAAAAKLPKAGKIMDHGQRAYLYPGDLIQLDGFRNPEVSTCSYVLHPLPPGWCRPARGGGRPSSASSSAAATTATATAATAAAAPARGGGGGGSGGGSGTLPPTVKKALAADSGGKGAEAGSPIIARRRASSPAGAKGASAPRGRAIYGPTGTVASAAPAPEPGAFQRGEAAAAASEVVAAAAAATAASLRTISAGAVPASDGKFPPPAPVGNVRDSRLSPSPTAAAAAASVGTAADVGVGAGAGVGVGVKRGGTPGVAARGPSSESGVLRIGTGRAVSPPVDGDTVKKKLRMSPGGPLDAAAATAAAAAAGDDGRDHDRDGVFSSPSSSFSPSPASEELRLLSEASRATPSPGDGSISVAKALASKKRPSPSAEKEEKKEEGGGRGRRMPVLGRLRRRPVGRVHAPLIEPAAARFLVREMSPPGKWWQRRWAALWERLLAPRGRWRR